MMCQAMLWTMYVSVLAACCFELQVVSRRFGSSQEQGRRGVAAIRGYRFGTRGLFLRSLHGIPSVWRFSWRRCLRLSSLRWISRTCTVLVKQFFCNEGGLEAAEDTA